MYKNQLKIWGCDIVSSSQKATNYIVHRLISAGAPLKIIRSNKTDTSEYDLNKDIEIYGDLRLRDIKMDGSYIYEWN